MFQNMYFKADFLSWQKSLAYSLRIFVDNFPLLSPLQRVLAAWLKIFNQFAIRSEEIPRHNTTTVVVQVFKMAERSDGCSGEKLLAPCTRKKRLQITITKDYYWIAVQENIGMFSKS